MPPCRAAFIRRGVLLVAAACCAVAGICGAAEAEAAQLNTVTTLADTAAVSRVAAGATQFTPAIDDLPLMEGLAPVADGDTVFVVPRAGRIAESVAAGPVDVDEVYRFYRRSLPQLGWKALDARTYAREGERLRIDAKANGKVTTVRFSVKPG